MAAGEQIALEPALAHMLGEHRVHDAAIGGQMIVRVVVLGVPGAVFHLEDRVEAVGVGLVRAEDAEVAAVGVEGEDIPHELTQLRHVLAFPLAVLGDLEGVIAEVRHAQIAQQQTAVAVGIGADAGVALRRESRDLGQQVPVLIEQLLRMVAAQPVLQQGQMLLALLHGDGHLVGQEVVLDPLAVHHLRAGPALGGAQHDHRPAGAAGIAGLAGVLLDGLDALDHRVHRLGHQAMHGHGLVALHEIGLPAAAVEEVRDLLMGHAGKEGGIGDLVAVEVQDGQHRAVAGGVEELVALPGGGQRAGLGLAITHGDSGDQVGVIEHRAEGVGNAVAQLAALVDGTRRLGRAVAGHAAGEGELLEELLHAGLILGDVGIDLAVGAVHVVVGDVEVAAVAGAGEKDQVQIVALDDAVEMDKDKVLPGHRAPVADDLFLDHIQRQRLFEQRVFQQIELPGREIVGRAEPGVHFREQGFGDRPLFLAQGLGNLFHRLRSFS